MIAFPQRLPHIVWTSGRLVPLSEGWLAETLTETAHRAGQPDWPLADHVAIAIAAHLEEEPEMPTMQVAELELLLQQALMGIGWGELAPHCRMQPPRVCIRLPDIAATSQYEMLFYPLLKERLEEAISFNVKGIRLDGLRQCSKMLDCAQRWRPSCGRISDDIITYTRDVFSRAAGDKIELVIC
ncbi:hypothetical protein DB346_06300 [Verrucomicrobia bacterium LW23]|nr:hypothetical protein DB346_06300 [Verrucomicrobia bacterium LW23]